MPIELISIGDEVLSGMTVNTNASFLSKLISESGGEVMRHTVVGDDVSLCRKVIEEALLRGSFVITTGGLGPTLDDHTRKVVAELFRRPPLFREDIFQKLLTRYHYVSQDNLKDQSTYPEGAILLENSIGTASGFMMKDEKLFPKAKLMALPGVPQELYELGERYIPENISEHRSRFVKVLHFVRLKEPEVDPVLRELAKENPTVSFGIYPAFGELQVHLKSYEEQALKAPEQKLLEEFGEYRLPNGSIVTSLHELLIQKKLTLACAESCTGGAISHRFVELPDASKYLQGGVVAYSNEVKEELLKVTALEMGAVSQEVASQMASRVASLCHADIGIGVTGILGPSGGTLEKPVGTVWASIFYQEKNHSWKMVHRGTRKAILERTVQNILGSLFLLLTKGDIGKP